MGDLGADLVASGGATAAGVGGAWPIRVRRGVTEQRWGAVIGCRWQI